MNASDIAVPVHHIWVRGFGAQDSGQPVSGLVNGVARDEVVGVLDVVGQNAGNGAGQSGEKVAADRGALSESALIANINEQGSLAPVRTTTGPRLLVPVDPAPGPQLQLGVLKDRGSNIKPGRADRTDNQGQRRYRVTDTAGHHDDLRLSPQIQRIRRPR